MLGAAIVGCGGIAESKYLRNLPHLAGVEAVGFLGGRAEAYCAKYGAVGARVYADMQALCADARVDLVFICTPNDTHAALSTMALCAGKHVLCEKPMAIEQAGAETMLHAAREHGCVLSIGHQARFSEAALALQAQCRAGALGELYFARASMLRRRGVPTWGHFLDKERQGGGCLMDLGTHALDLALWLIGDFEPAYVVCSAERRLADKPSAANRWGAWDASKFEVEDAAFGFIKLKGGATVALDCSFALNISADREEHVLLCGTEAGAELSPGGFVKNGDRNGAFYEEQTLFAEDEDGANRRQLADFVRAVREGGEPLVTAAQSLAVCRILLALYRSAAENRPISFP